MKKIILAMVVVGVICGFSIEKLDWQYIVGFLFFIIVFQQIYFGMQISEIHSKITRFENDDINNIYDKINFLMSENNIFQKRICDLEFMHTEPTIEDLNHEYNPLMKHPIPAKIDEFIYEIQHITMAFNSWIPILKQIDKNRD